MHGGGMTEDEPVADINMIPLIDISLTLLIILMVTTTFARKPGVNLKLPETVTREGAQETPKDLTVAVSSTGDLYLNGVLTAPVDLQARLREYAAKDKEARVMIRGDRSVMYARMMEVMDMIRQAGLTRVVLPTDPKTLLQAPVNAPTTSAPMRGTPFGQTGGQGDRATGGSNSNTLTPNTQTPNTPTTQRPNTGEARTP